MKSNVQDFPQARTVPSDVLRALRAIDPTAEVIYLGPSPKGGQWGLATYDPDHARCRRAWRALAEFRTRPAFKQNAQWALRIHVARLNYRGYRIRHIWECVEPTSWHVEAVRFAHYDHLNTSDNEFFRQMDERKEAEMRANEADLTDPGRAREFHHYTTTRSHMPSAPLQALDRVKSGWVRHSIPSTAA